MEDDIICTAGGGGIEDTPELLAISKNEEPTLTSDNKNEHDPNKRMIGDYRIERTLG